MKGLVCSSTSRGRSIQVPYRRNGLRPARCIQLASENDTLEAGIKYLFPDQSKSSYGSVVIFMIEWLLLRIRFLKEFKSKGDRPKVSGRTIKPTINGLLQTLRLAHGIYCSGSGSKSPVISSTYSARDEVLLVFIYATLEWLKSMTAKHKCMHVIYG
jgi:hypothetical protein